MSALPKGFAPIAIGLCLTLIHLIGYPGHQRVREPGAAALDRRCLWAAGLFRNCGGVLGWRLGAGWRACGCGVPAAGQSEPQAGKRSRRAHASASKLSSPFRVMRASPVFFRAAAVSITQLHDFAFVNFSQSVD